MKYSTPILAAISFAMSFSATAAQSSPIVINDNAAWCWFQDERAIISQGQMFVGSVASKLGADGKARSGNIEVTRFPLNDNRLPVTQVLHSGLEDDDHNVPALIALDNKNVLAAYSKHNTDRNIRIRHLSTGKLDEWDEELSMARKDKITYTNLLHLKSENNGKGRLYNFYRGLNFNPTFDTSDDGGKTWTKGHHFIKNAGRPYVKYISNEKDEIHFVTTEQHPRVFNNSIYHGVMKNGKILNSFGKPVHDLAEGPVAIDKLTKVYQGGPDNVAWTTDLHLDKQGKPYTVFSVQVNDSNKQRNKGKMHGDDMRYFYASLETIRYGKFKMAIQRNRLRRLQII